MLGPELHAAGRIPCDAVVPLQGAVQAVAMRVEASEDVEGRDAPQALSTVLEPTAAAAALGADELSLACWLVPARVLKGWVKTIPRSILQQHVATESESTQLCERRRRTLHGGCAGFHRTGRCQPAVMVTK